MEKKIRIRGARQNNLKNIDLDLPQEKLIVLTGLSGSGKSSLAFDTLYAEGHRRFVESLSSYARMFLGQLDKPDVDSVEGLSPAIAINQKTTSKNPRSTVGTVTEIYDYLRLLYARVGIPHCPVCGKEIRPLSQDAIVEEVMRLPEGVRFLVLSPLVRGQKGTQEKVLADLRRKGYARVYADGILYDLTEEIPLRKNEKHTVEAVVDRLVMKEELRSRLSDSVENALRLSDGRVTILPVAKEGEEALPRMEFSTSFACEEHKVSFGELEPRMFSFNNPFGACPTCTGLGETRRVSLAKLIRDPSLSLREGALAANGFKSMTEDGWSGPLVAALGEDFGFTLDTPIKDFSKEALNALLYGHDKKYHVVRYFGKERHEGYAAFEGVVTATERRAMAGGFGSEGNEELFEDTPCPDCGGSRLSPAPRCVTVAGKTIDGFCRLPIGEALTFISELTLSESDALVAKEILKEIRARLGFLKSVGLEYLTLGRKAGSLSGGEAQRIRLATQIGSALSGVLYVLDEPSIGLHQRDNRKLIATLKRLRDLGNTVVVVEHDEETMREADFLVDIGPGAGVHGGEVIASGTPDEVANCKQSLTGDYLSGRKVIAVPKSRRPGNGKFLTVKNPRENNLKGMDVTLPLGLFLCVTGVSGSGKSSLVNAIIRETLDRDLNRAITAPGKSDGVTGQEALDKMIAIDQSPIGRTPRSNPATYTGLFTDIRNLFASTKDAKARGYGPGRFSFNVRGGRCEACQGDGVKCIEMHFLPDVYVKCDLCKGARYNLDTLEVKYKGKNISEVLEMTVEEGMHFFSELPALKKKLETLYDVGLGYLKIGQSSTTLSGGEAQRVKLATELAKRSTGRTLYILDEPTTGLHTHDVARLIAILDRLTEAGNSVLVIEHNLDLIKCADYLLDLGPEGGDAGGRIVTAGTPEEVAACPASYTGLHLREVLGLPTA